MTEKLVLNIDSMVCNGCVKTISQKLSEIGLNNPEFNLEEKKLFLEADQLNEKEILKTLRRANYPATVV